MRKSILLTTLAFLFSGGSVYAQKGSVKMQDTQARLVDIYSRAYVKPLTVELLVDKNKGRITDEWPLTKEQAETEMGGNLENIRSYAVYMSSQKHQADAIVAATFNFRTNNKGDGYLITVTGYPASFTNWKTAEENDYEWIRMEKTLTTDDRIKMSAIVK